jgi:hypothetical protein
MCLESLIIVGCYGQMLRYYGGVVVLSSLGASTVLWWSGRMLIYLIIVNKR